MLDFLLQYDLTTHFQAFLLGSTRLMVFAAVAPFMGNQVLNMTVRSAVVMALYLVVHPTVVSTMPVFSPLSPGALALLGGLLHRLFGGLLRGLGRLLGLLGRVNGLGVDGLLRRGGLISRRRSGRRIFYKISETHCLTILNCMRNRSAQPLP